jgi:predicted RNase H-like HicB family nuclease
MGKMSFQAKLTVTFLREKRRFIAYSPALDLSTSGRTFKEARERFTEAVMLFFEELNRKDATEEVLKELGWQKFNREWKPPVVVSQESETIRIPAAA